MSQRRSKRTGRAARAATKRTSTSTSSSTSTSESTPIETQRLREAIAMVNSMQETTPSDSRRRRRPRPTPTFLLEQPDHDAIAKRRVLMILRVLSGETPVTDAIEGSDISRQAYYQLEERALRAMMRALTPGVDATVVTGPDPAMIRRIAELEVRTKQLEQEKRRAERMLYLTRKVVPAGPMKSTLRGRPKKASRSTSSGAGDSRARVAENSTSATNRVDDRATDSTRRRSADEPHGGTAS